MMEQTLYELLRDCTVLIAIPGVSQGTGFFVAPDLILTCAHVVEAAQENNTPVEVHWNGQVMTAQIQEFHSAPYPDLALLQVDLSDHPCVLLKGGAEPFSELYSYSYYDIEPHGASKTFDCEGWAGSEQEQLRFKQGQVRPGMSGSPLLNQNTGSVCGIVQLTYDRNAALGGKALLTKAVFREFPSLESEQQRFHKQDRQWIYCLAIYQASSVLSSFQVLSEQFFAEQGESSYSETLKLRRASWSLILKGDDYIDRDQQERCLEEAKKLADFPGISLQVLRGSPGNGKTAMLLWLAHKLVRERYVVLSNTKRLDFSGWLKELRDFSRKIGGQHFYLIIDDIFREPAVLYELKDCQERFPLTIIGTTLPNDDRHQELQGLIEVASPIDILPPSDEEKGRVLRKISSRDPNIEAELNRLTNERKQALLDASTMLILICQVSQVKHFDLIVGDIIKQLPSTLRRQDDIPAYEIFGTICSFSQLGIISPADIIASCVSKEISRKVTSASIRPWIESPHLNGLVVTGQKAGYDGFEAFHEFLARKAVEVRYTTYVAENPPYAPTLLHQNLESAISDLDAENELHGRWVYISFRRLVATGQVEIARLILNSHSEKIYALQARNSVLGWFSWAEIYKGVNLPDESERCLNAVLATQPRSDWEWAYWLGQVEKQLKRGRNDDLWRQAQHSVSAWLQGGNEDNVGMRAKYLDLVGRYGSPSEVRAEIDKTSAWLQVHPRDINVRTKYLQMVKDKGDFDQKLKAVGETRDWLERDEESRANTNVRAQYLRLIKQGWVDEVKDRVINTINFRGTLEELIQREIYEIPIWLNTYKFDKTPGVRIADNTSDVRVAYLDLIEKRGTPEQKQKAVEETRDWLREYRAAGVSNWLRLYPEMDSVFAKYFVLFEKTRLDDSVVQSIIAETWQWIREWDNYGKPVKQELWTALLPRLGRCKDIQIFYEVLYCARKQHPKNDRVIGIILALYRTSLSPEDRQDDAYQLSRSIVGDKLPNSTLRRYLLLAANVLRDLPPHLRDFDSAEAIYRRLIHWCKGKYGQDALETLRDAQEDYKQLLLLKEQFGGRSGD